MTEITATTGSADFSVDGKTYQTYYVVYGDLKSASRRPLVGVHGGPGFSHHYLIPNKELYSRAGIPVILYDQIGNGKSSHIQDAPKEFWNPGLFMDELENLLRHLGVQEDFDLLGHSWGGMLAGEFAARRQPPGLKNLIIANSPASADAMMKGFNDLLDKLPGGVAEIVRKNEEAGTLENVEYQDAVQVFQKKHLCDLDPWPEHLAESFEEYKKDQTVYLALWGTLEFQFNGNLKDWSIVDVLHKISVPTLLLTSPQDEIQPIAYTPFVTEIPKIKWVDIPGCSHVAMYEAPEKYYDAVVSFLST